MTEIYQLHNVNVYGYNRFRTETDISSNKCDKRTFLFSENINLFLKRRKV